MGIENRGLWPQKGPGLNPAASAHWLGAQRLSPEEVALSSPAWWRDLSIRPCHKEKTWNSDAATASHCAEPSRGFFRALTCDISTVFCSHFLMQLESRLLLSFVLLREMQACFACFLLTWIPRPCVFLVQGGRERSWDKLVLSQPASGT